MSKTKLIIISVLSIIAVGAAVICVLSLNGGLFKNGDSSSSKKTLYLVEYLVNDENASNDKLEEDAKKLSKRFNFKEFSSVKVKTTGNGIKLDIYKSKNFDIALQYLTTQGRLYFQVNDIEYDVTEGDIEEIRVEALATNESGEAVDYAVRLSLTTSGQEKLYEACEVAAGLDEEIKYVHLKIDNYVLWNLTLTDKLHNMLEFIQITGGYTKEEANIIVRAINSEDLNYSYTQQVIIDKSSLSNSSSN